MNARDFDCCSGVPRPNPEPDEDDDYWTSEPIENEAVAEWWRNQPESGGAAMSDRPDITIPEEAIVAACNAYEAAVLGVGHEDSDDLANHEEIAAVRAAAPLILAAELERLADRIQSEHQDPDASEREDGYDEACDDIGVALRVRAAELRGATRG